MMCFTLSNKMRHLNNTIAAASNYAITYNVIVAYELLWFGGNMIQHNGDIPF